MIGVDIRIDGGASLEEAMGRALATEEQIRRAAARGVNKTVRSIRMFVAKDTAKFVGAKQTAISKRIFTTRASPHDLQSIVSLRLKDSRVPVAAFGRAVQTRKGVRIGKANYRGAFIAKLPQRSGIGVFRRKGADRFPIADVMRKIEPSVFHAMELAAGVMVGPTLQKRFLEELRYETRVK